VVHKTVNFEVVSRNHVRVSEQRPSQKDKTRLRSHDIGEACVEIVS
jgi:hypothetical protein